MLEQAAREDLIDFSILTNDKYIPNWHHELVARHLYRVESGLFQRTGKKILMIFQPPRHGKSEEGTINFPGWFIGRNPDKEIITASYSSELAVDFGTRTRDLVALDVYGRIFPGIRLRADVQAKSRWMIEGHRGSASYVGVGGSITGKGADVFIIDDPLKNAKEAESKVIRDAQWDWFKSVAWTRLEPGAVIIIILTRWHMDDLAGRIMNTKDYPEFDGLFETITLPAIATMNDKYRKIGDALWPDKYGLDELEKTRQVLGPYMWSALYQQAPIASEKQEFKPHWYKKITRAEVEAKNTLKYLTIDTALSKKSSADYTGICENFVCRDNFWHIAGYRRRFDPKDLVDFLFTSHANRRWDKIGIERTAYLEGLKPYIEEQQRLRDVYLPIVELEHNQINKEVRIRGMIPRYSGGSVYHIEGECDDLEDEQALFPQSPNDDTMDAEAYQVQLVEAPIDKAKKVKQPVHEVPSEFFGN